MKTHIRLWMYTPNGRTVWYQFCLVWSGFSLENVTYKWLLNLSGKITTVHRLFSENLYTRMKITSSSFYQWKITWKWKLLAPVKLNLLVDAKIAPSPEYLDCSALLPKLLVPVKLNDVLVNTKIALSCLDCTELLIKMLHVSIETQWNQLCKQWSQLCKPCQLYSCRRTVIREPWSAAVELAKLALLSRTASTIPSCRTLPQWVAVNCKWAVVSCCRNAQQS